MDRRRLVLLALLAALSLLAAACGGEESEPVVAGEEEVDEGEALEEEAPEEEVAEATGGEFSVFISEPESLVPQNTNETNGAEVLNALFSGLVDFDPETTEPLWGEDSSRALAESIESEDQRVWTIKIKPGYTFHNGEPVTAQSFVDAWNFGAYAPNAQGNAYFFDKIEGYEDLQCGPGAEEEPDCEVAPPVSQEMSGLRVIDDQTFEVTLKEPFSQFPLTVGYTAFYPLPSVAFEDPEAFNEAPIGNGPFMMDGEWVHNQEINMVRFPDYAGEPAKADAVTFRIYAEQDTAYNDLLAGNLDVMDQIPPAQLQAAQAEFGDNYLERESSSFQYLGFPLYDERFQNPDLRKAFSMAIDREAIANAVRPDFTPARSLVSPVVAGSRENPCEACEYDPEQAKQLFDAAGGYDGTLTLWFNAGAGHDEWVNAVANQLRQNLGIEDIQFQQLQFAEYLGLLDNEEITGPFRLGWVMDYPSPQNYLEPIYGTNGSSNNFGYSNPEVDELIAQGNRAGSIEEGIEFYQQAEDLILQDMPNIPMFFGRVSGAHTDRVENVVIDPFTRINTADIVVNEE